MYVCVLVCVFICVCMCLYVFVQLRRLEAANAGQLIFYNCPDTSGPKLSDFRVSQVGDVEGMKTLLSLALGAIGCVKKVWTLYMVGQT